MSAERKATDILIDLENKIDDLVRRVNSQDLVLKAQLIRINKLVSLIENFEKPNPEKIIKKEFSSPKLEAVSDSIIVAPKLAVAVEENLIQQNKPEQQEEFKEYSETFNISQRVLDENSKVLYMAVVEVIDLNSGNKVTRTQTKANGKFILKLKPGNYRFKISKTKNLQTGRIESFEDITVVGDIHLPDFILK